MKPQISPSPSRSASDCKALHRYHVPMFARMPAMPLLLKRGCIRGLKNVVREDGWAGSVGSLFGVLLLGQVLLLLVFSAHVGVQFLREQTDLRLEILDSASDDHIQDLVQNVRSLPYVEEVLYVTREQAFERQRERDPQLIAFLEKFGIANPFPETLGVRLKSIADYPRFLQFLQQPVFAQTIDPQFLSQTTDQERQLYQLVGIVSSARTFLIAVVILFVLVLLFVIAELIRRRAMLRRDEVFVEQLVGAPAIFTALPFAVEIALLLLVSLVLSLLFAAAAIAVAPAVLPSLAAGGAFAVWGQAIVATLLQWLPLTLLAQFLLIPALAVAATAFVLWSRLQGSMLSMA